MRRLDPNHKTLVCKEITIFKINCKTILLVAEVVQKAKKKEKGVMLIVENITITDSKKQLL